MINELISAKTQNLFSLHLSANICTIKLKPAAFQPKPKATIFGVY